MNKLETILKSVKGVGGKVWIEEITLRGRPSGDSAARFGEISGAHWTLGVEEPDHDGKPTRSVYGPYPISELPTDAPLASLLDKALVAATATIKAQADTIESREKTIMEQEKALLEAKALLKAVEDRSPSRLDLARSTRKRRD